MGGKRIKVVIGTPCYTGTMDVEAAGRMGMYLYKLGKTHPELDVEWHIVRRTFVHTARNNVVHYALDPEINADYIWWVDDDCILNPKFVDGREVPKDFSLLPRLIAHDKDVVIVPYFLRQPPHACGVLRATDHKDPSSYWNIKSAELNKGLIEVAGGGTHCMLLKTSMIKDWDLPWFALPEFGGTEDMYMCLKAKNRGYKIYCDSDIEVGHVGYAPVIGSKEMKVHEKT